MQTNKSHGFFTLIFANLRGDMYRLLHRKQILPLFPKQIGEYYFDKHLKKEGLRKSYQIAFYKNKKGKKAIAKMIGTQVKGYHYYSLLNEINTYKTLFTTRERIKKILPSDIKHIIIPKLVTVEETDQYLVELMEFVEGIPAEKKSDKEKVAIYFSVLKFLHFLGNHMLPEEKKHISQRTMFHYIFLYPFLVSKAVLTYPFATVEILKGIPVFLSAVFKFKELSWNNLSHRDLHLLNILVSDTHTAIIDLQQCVFTNNYHDFITTLKEVWKLDGFYKVILQEIFKKHAHEKNFLTFFRAFAVNSVTHGLTGSGFSKKTIENWVNYLRFAIAIKKVEEVTKKAVTVTVGIPAYNEEKNIRNVLTSIFSQEQNNYVIEKVIIASDGSTDKTVEFVKKCKDSRIQLIARKEKKGVNYTKNEIIKNVKSDILVFLNGDVILKNKNTLEDLILPIKNNKQVAYTSGYLTGAKPTNFFESIIRDSHYLKQFMGKHVHKGDNVYMSYGGLQALSKKLYSHMIFPLDVPEDAYLYLYCIIKGFQFAYVEDAKVIFRLPATFVDHKKQSTRFISGRESLKKYFDTSFLTKAYKIPASVFILSNTLFFLKNPVTLTLYIFLTMYLRIISKQYTFTSSWEPSVTSKEVLI